MTILLTGVATSNVSHKYWAVISLFLLYAFSFFIFTLWEAASLHKNPPWGERSQIAIMHYVIMIAATVTTFSLFLNILQRVNSDRIMPYALVSLGIGYFAIIEIIDRSMFAFMKKTEE